VVHPVDEIDAALQRVFHPADTRAVAIALTNGVVATAAAVPPEPTELVHRGRRELAELYVRATSSDPREST
jgi:hypothetical protein